MGGEAGNRRRPGKGTVKQGNEGEECRTVKDRHAVPRG